MAFRSATLVSEIPSKQYFFEIAENDLMSNNFNLIVIGKKDLRAHKIVMTNVDLVKDRHQ